MRWLVEAPARICESVTGCPPAGQPPTRWRHAPLRERPAVRCAGLARRRAVPTAAARAPRGRAGSCPTYRPPLAVVALRAGQRPVRARTAPQPRRAGLPPRLLGPGRGGDTPRRRLRGGGG